MRLLWLPDVLRAAGLVVHEYPGWKTRGSAEWGPDTRNSDWRLPLRGVVCHATAGNRHSTDAGETKVLWITGSTSAPAPISQLYLSRSGEWTVGASGRCNHVLRGDKSGIHRGFGNYQLLGIEAQNDNRGEPWSADMVEAYRRGVAAICAKMGWSAQVVVGHAEHQSGKTDPLGVDMDAFREAVDDLLDGKAPTPAPSPRRRPAPGPPVPFPLPDGYFFGPKDWGDESVSGFHGRLFRGRRDFEWMREFVRQLRKRGWDARKGGRYLTEYGNDGRYGPEYQALFEAFQRDQGLLVDGLNGINTWTAAYHNRVT